MYICLAQVLAFEPNVNPVFLFLLLGFVVGIVILRFVNKYIENTAAVKKKKPVKTTHSYTSAPEPVKQELDRKEFKLFVAQYNLNRDQSVFFEKVCKTYRINRPFRLVQNRKDLDELFNRVFRQLQETFPTTRESEQEKTLLFTIRETIENNRKAAKNISSSRALQNGQPITFITRGDEQYPTTIIENASGGLLCKVPRDAFGNELRLPLWSKVRVFFSSRSGQSYRFSVRILRFESGNNETRMLLAHTNTVQTLPNRRHDRKAFETFCYYAPVTVANVVNGKHTEHKFYPSPKSFGGTIRDISVGGCSISAKAPLKQGEYVQIVCNLEPKIEEKIIGKIIRVLKTDGDPTMHIQFAKMSRPTMNRIFSYIFNYGDNLK